MDSERSATDGGAKDSARSELWFLGGRFGCGWRVTTDSTKAAVNWTSNLDSREVREDAVICEGEQFQVLGIHLGYCVSKSLSSTYSDSWKNEVTLFLSLLS